MKFARIILNIVGVLFILAGFFFFFIALAISDPEIEGESARTSLGTYFTTLIPVAVGILLLWILWKANKNKISN